MTGGHVLAILLLLGGVLAACLGAGVYAGGSLKSFYRRLWKVGLWNSGPSASIALLPIGVAIVLVAIALLFGSDGGTASLLVAALVIAAAGVVIYVADPAWIKPQWARLESTAGH